MIMISMAKKNPSRSLADVRSLVYEAIVAILSGLMTHCLSYDALFG